MLQEILDYIHNYFIVETHIGEFEIKSGSLDVDFLLDGQYFTIKGSKLNDGIYKFGEDELVDENFVGKVMEMSIPKAVLDVDKDASAWVENYGNVVNSPFQSESWGGYSYTKASGNGKNGNVQVTWQDKFGSRLNAYRKIS